MTELSDVVEVQELQLKVLSEGIPFLLERCEVISPDTSFVVTGLSNWHADPSSWMARYSNSPSRAAIVPAAVMGIFESIVLGTEDGINLDDLYSTINGCTSVSHSTLRALIDLEQNGRLVLSPHTLAEVRESHRVTSKNIENFCRVYSIIMETGYSRRMYERDPISAVSLGDKRKKFFQSLYVEYVRELIEITNTNLESLEYLLGVVDVNGRTLRESFLFLDPDKKIIDSSLDALKPVGIITCDSHFPLKTRQVIRTRRTSKLKVPKTHLMLVENDMRTYRVYEYN